MKLSRALAAFLLIITLALLPRMIALDQVATVDEPAPWYPRTIRFLQALESGNFAETYQIGHPGVTTMWLGSLGLLGQRWLAGFGLLTDTDTLLQLAVLRTPTALVNGLAVALGYLLLRRLFTPGTALMAALLWAADPFLVAHARVFHLDALLASFSTLALLALLLALREERRPGLVVLSGVCAGLAFLTKVPSVALLPVALLAGAAAAWQGAGSLRQRVAPMARALVLWGMVALATVVLLWPALWVAPVETLRKMVETARLEAGEGHSNGNFFLGQPDPAPGPLFYPLVLALRLTPWAWLGLLVLPLALRGLPESRRGERRDLALLAAFALAFALLVTLSPKKFDRYLLPAFPALNILAAYGLANGLRPRALRLPALGATLALAGATLWWYYPNYLSYNPLLGGGTTAQYALPVGWGEGIDEARAWLNSLPDSEKLAVASRSNALLGPRARFKIVSFDDVPAGPADFPNYVLLYVSNVQRQRLTPNAQWYFDNALPAHVVHLHGIDYAWIYQVPPPVPRPLAATFGPSIRLRGYDQPAPPGRAAPLRLRLFWEARAALSADYLLFAHLIGPDGRRYAQLDLPPGGDQPTSGWGQGRYYISGVDLPIPQDAPPGRYRVVIGLYSLADGARLALAGQPAADPALAGPSALELTSFELPR